MKSLVVGVVLGLCSMAWGDPGDHVGNGGDICENRFQAVRNDLQSWILLGGGSGLQLPKGISLGSYNQSMLANIAAAKVSCTTQTLAIGSAEKTCVNYVAADQKPMIVCNASRFLNTSENDQYVLVHHEYAGLSKLEVNLGESSDYSISNQIAYFLENHVVKKLVIKGPPPSPGDAFDPKSCVGEPLSESAAFAKIPLPNSTIANIGSFRVYLRTRLCYTVDGCTAWSMVGPSTDQYLTTIFEDSPWVSFSPQIPTDSGVIQVRLVKNRTQVVLNGKPYKVVNSASDFHPSWTLSMFYNYDFSGVPSGEVVAITDLVETTKNPIRFPGGSPFLLTSGVINQNCIRLTSRATYERKDNAGNTIRDEFQAVILGRID